VEKCFNTAQSAVPTNTKASFDWFWTRLFSRARHHWKHLFLTLISGFRPMLMRSALFWDVNSANIPEERGSHICFCQSHSSNCYFPHWRCINRIRTKVEILFYPMLTVFRNFLKVSSLRPCVLLGTATCGWRWVWSIGVMIVTGGGGESNISEKNLSKGHSSHHKCHMDWPGIEPGPPWWEAVN
jgi:hypothetical protein